MALTRENILSLIGSRRYHSAILTTFSFDFYFFEMKVMRWFRSCGIRNVNVLIDGHYYSELMRQNAGDEMQLSPGYSLYPMFQDSIFHPKLWMLLGEEQGLLIVGSGNLTNAGNGTNDEIWGAFHFDARQKSNWAMISSAWSYIQILCSSTKGYIKEKTTKWIIEHSPWLKELPKPPLSSFKEVGKGEQAAFLYNSNEATLIKQIETLIGKEKMVEITILSPYYDLNGKGIKALAILYPNASINVILDTSGSVPEQLSNPNHYRFYDWYDVGVSKTMRAKSDYPNSCSRLHAKILLFRTRSGTEYLMFGSANVTPQGLGLPNTKANAEAVVLFQQKEGGLLNKLGIKLKAPRRLSDFKASRTSSIFETIVKENSYKLRLLSAEILYNELFLYLEGDYPRVVTLKMLSRESTVIHSQQLSELVEEARIKLTVPSDDIHHVVLADSDTGKSISNALLISNHYLLAKTHPNPQNEAIEQIYNEIQNGELSRILDLLPFALNDDTEELALTTNNANSRSQLANEDRKAVTKLYDLSSYKHVSHDSLEKSLLLSSNSLRVLDVLRFAKMGAAVMASQAELRIDEQEENIGSSTGVDEKDLGEIENIPFHVLKLERRKLLQYFNQLGGHQRGLVSMIRKNSKDKYQPSITDLSRFVIALELLLEFGGKREKYAENGKLGTFSYLEFNGDVPFYNDSVKGMLFKIIGDFLVMAKSGFKEYEFEYTKAKLEQLKFEALVLSLVCILNIRWKESELPYLNTILLNCLHYLGDKTPSAFDALLPRLYSAVYERKKGLKNLTGSGEENWDWFKTRIVRAFKKAIKRLDTQTFDHETLTGDVIYKSPWGYCYVKNMTKGGDMTLVRPGFIWDEKEQDFVKYADDEVYRPLRLPQFINVKI